MGTRTLLLFLKAIAEDSNLANFPGLVPAVDAFCWIHKAISLSFPGSETIESENFLSALYAVTSAYRSLFHLDREISIPSPNF